MNVVKKRLFPNLFRDTLYCRTSKAFENSQFQIVLSYAAISYIPKFLQKSFLGSL